ncbi:MAG: lipocalin-like domain-containing protein [Bacteroidaceae bacterium]|nr:lipocalin-like domain-containing protein [Bacteroidaceae bacterium]
MRHIPFVMALAAALVWLGSCTLEHSDNGKLDGFWFLNSIDTMATGGRKQMDASQVTWGFQHRLLEVRTGEGDAFYFRFAQSTDSLILSHPVQYAGQGVETVLESAGLLQPWGVNRLEEHFSFVKLSGSKMVLQSTELRLNFTKL